MDGQVYYHTLATERLYWTCHTLTHTSTCRFESVRKTVERVFGMLKKSFHILKLSLLGGDIEEIENMLFSCFMMHNMNLTDKGRMDLGHMAGDWCDHAPGVNRARRTLYDIVNGHTLFFNTRAYIVTDNTNFSLLGCQISHPNFCNATNTVTPTENASDFKQRHEVLASHHEIVSGPRFSGPQADQRMCLLPATRVCPSVVMKRSCIFITTTSLTKCTFLIL